MLRFELTWIVLECYLARHIFLSKMHFFQILSRIILILTKANEISVYFYKWLWLLTLWFLALSCCKNLIFSGDERKIFNQPSQRILYPVELAHGVRPQAMPAEICTFRRQEVCTLMSERGKSTGGSGLNESECMSVSKFLSERQIGPNYRIILNVSFWLLKAGKK